MNWKDKEQVRRRARRYNKKWRTTHKTQISTYHLRTRIKNPERTIFNRTKASAKLRGLEFNLSLQDVVIPTHCPYLGVQFTNIQGQGKENIYFNPSLDRIDNTKGYIKGNVEIISHRANTMKNSASINELQNFAKAILARFPC